MKQNNHKSRDNGSDNDEFGNTPILNNSISSISNSVKVENSMETSYSQPSTSFSGAKPKRSSKNESDDDTVIKNESDDDTVIKNESDDDTVIKNESDDDTVIKNESDDDTVIKNESDSEASSQGSISVASSKSDRVEFENTSTVDTSTNQEAVSFEISDDESNEATCSIDGTRSQANVDDNISPIRPYGLRRKRKINYGEMEKGSEVDTRFPNTEITNLKKDVLDIFSFSNSKIAKFTQNMDLVDTFTKCKILVVNGTEASSLNSVKLFFQKCGSQFESLFIQVEQNDADSHSFLKSILKYSSTVTRLHFQYQNQDDAYYLLKLVKNITDTNGLPTLNSLKLISVHGSESLREKHIALLSEMQIQFQSIELGDALWEDVKAGTLEKFLNNQKLNLETLVINGGFRGDGDKEKVLILLPKMEVLKNMSICPEYNFQSEFKNPNSKKAHVIALDDGSTEEPFKIAIKFTCDLPNLQRLSLGNLIDVEDLKFSSVRKLTEFRCGSYWNLSIRFPLDGSRKSLLESRVKELQFPDCLKDPLFTVNVAKHFVHLKKVCLYLPSIPVLKAFFKAFTKCYVEELYLKLQFDFEKMIESCLLPKMRDVLEKSRQNETILQTLKEYKHFDEYVRYYNIELPVEVEDLMEGYSAGISALKNLKVLYLEHIPRTLLIPVPDEERKWFDHNCKFMSTTFGHQKYPMSLKCYREILKLNLSEYIWKNIEIKSKYCDDYYEAGFADIPDVKVNRKIGASYGDDDGEEIFTRNHTQVEIMPSMLLPSIRRKKEKE